MTLFKLITKELNDADLRIKGGADLLIINKAEERQLYLENSIPKSTDIADAFDIEVIVTDEVKCFRLFNEV